MILRRAVFALVSENELEIVRRAFLGLVEPESIMVTDIDNEGARVLITK